MEIQKQLENFYQAYPIIFDEKAHRYSLDGEVFAGVSSISEYAPKDYLKFWAAKMVVDYLEDKLEAIRVLDKEQWLDLLEEAKNQHTKKSKEALDIGSRVHYWIEQHILEKDLEITPDIKNPVEEFLKFEKQHKVEWIISEKLVASITHKIAGRLDAIAKVDRKLSLVDLKTSSQISEDYLLQTAGYQLCLEEMGIKVEQRIILRLPKKQGDEFEAVLIDTSYKEDKDAFLHRRYSYQWANMINSKHTEETEYVGKNGRKYKIKKLKIIKL